MITYEANVICDKCGSHHVTGEPMESADDAKRSATTYAKRAGWRQKYDLRWICPDCQPQHAKNNE